MPLKTQKKYIVTYNDSDGLAYFFSSENDSTYPKDSVSTTTVASTVPSCEYSMNTKNLGLM